MASSVPTTITRYREPSTVKLETHSGSSVAELAATTRMAYGVFESRLVISYLHSELAALQPVCMVVNGVVGEVNLMLDSLSLLGQVGKL